jgi:hypothetical protein
MKTRILGFALLATLATVPSAGAAQTLPLGYHIWPPDQSLDLTLHQNWPSAFHALIRRDAPTPEDERRVRLAESLYPAADSTRARACPEKRAADNLWEVSCASQPVSPFALTAGAVKHYIALIARYRSGDFGEVRTPPISGSMEYHASSRLESDFQIRDQRFTDVHVVTLRLHWQLEFGPFSGYSFRKQRVVVFSRSNDVLAVEGDGRTLFRVQ